ncbi:MAG: hypothetical protein WBQ20_00040, partial [Methyloceanibacter sp.]
MDVENGYPGHQHHGSTEEWAHSFHLFLLTLKVSQRLRKLQQSHLQDRPCTPKQGSRATLPQDKSSRKSP